MDASQPYASRLGPVSALHTHYKCHIHISLVIPRTCLTTNTLSSTMQLSKILLSLLLGITSLEMQVPGRLSRQSSTFLGNCNDIQQIELFA